MKNKQGPKILVIDVETSPLITYTWGLFDQNIPLAQLKEDTYLLSYAAKWLGEKPIFYADQSKAKDIKNDKKLLEEIWKLLDEADFVLGQNSRAFDTKRINARFVTHDMDPPSSYKHLDTLLLAKKHFNFTSNKLEFLSGKLCKKFKKLKHKKYAGFDLWLACLDGDKDAWAEMRAYNINDVLATEELYNKLSPFDTSISFAPYYDDDKQRCKCGSTNFSKNGFFYTSVNKFQRYKCKACGSEAKDRKKFVTKAKA